MKALSLGRAEKTGPSDAVNLLSPAFLEDLAVIRLRSKMALGVGLVLLLVVSGWAFQVLSLRSAEATLAGEEAAAAARQAQITELAPVRSYVEGVRGRATAVETTMSTDISFSQSLLSLVRAAPTGITIDSVAVTVLTTDQAAAASGVVAAAPEPTTTDGTDGAEVPAPAVADDPTRGLSGSGCPGPDPFAAKPSVGCLIISGTATDRRTVGQLVQRLAQQDLFVEPFISTTTTDAADPAGGDSLSFSGTVGLTPLVFSGRYDDLLDQLGLEKETK